MSVHDEREVEVVEVVPHDNISNKDEAHHDASPKAHNDNNSPHANDNKD